MAKSTGLKAIAYELGVSVNTVSRALRDCKDISEHTKEIIRKKAYELGYIQSTVEKKKKKDENICMPVIRCKNCKWFGEAGCAIKIVDDSDKPTENDFCSFAELKEVEEEVEVK